MRKLAVALALASLPAALLSQGLDPALLGKPPVDSWPTHHGDYSGRRFSTLKQINATNVKGLTLAWLYRLNITQRGAIVGGEGPDVPPAGAGSFGNPTIKATPLLVDGTLYFSVPDHAYASRPLRASTA